MSNFPTPAEQPYLEGLTSVHVLPEAVKKKLEKLNPNKASGPDELHPRLLTEARDQIALFLSLLFNKSIEQGVLLEDWDVAHVCPIHKKGSKHQASNYRPVSLTSVICKLMESVLRDEIITHMNVNNFFTKHQHGFLGGRSTVTQLLETLEEWTNLLEKHDSIDVLYCDFQKAFDSVPHQRLISKVQSYGIGGNLLEWIKSFLLGRNQRVVLENVKSPWAAVSSGIPQGSVLGPLLFVIFINDIVEAIDCGIKIYTDDTKIYSPIDSAEDSLAFKQNIDNLLKWSYTRQLTFHPEKCHILHVGCKGEETYIYTMGQTELGDTQHEKDLSVYIDEDLSFQMQSHKVANAANQLVGICRRTFSFLDKETFLLLYKGLIHPKLEYVSSVWAPRLVRDIEVIESVQRRATKLIPGLEDLSYEERLRWLDLPSLVFRRIRGDMIQVYKYLHGEYNVDADKMLPRKENTMTRGNSLVLIKP